MEAGIGGGLRGGAGDQRGFLVRLMIVFLAALGAFFFRQRLVEAYPDAGFSDSLGGFADNSREKAKELWSKRPRRSAGPDSEAEAGPAGSGSAETRVMPATPPSGSADPETARLDQIEAAARRDDRVIWAQRVESDLMARSPVLVWRNATRIRLIHAFRAAFDAPAAELLPGEPLICDGLELPLKHRKKRIDLEARGLIKGAQAIYLGPGRKPGFSRLFLVGAPDPTINVASIIQIEAPEREEPFIPYAARMGAAFLHGAAVTIHKAQGSQWNAVQVFAPDLYAAAQAGRVEAGQALWKRLAYVAITRAEEKLIWVTRYALARPKEALGIEDLPNPTTALILEGPEET